MDFPVISIKESTIDLHDTAAGIRRCSRHAFRTGWYDGLQILDAGGVLYVVKGATFEGKAKLTMFSGWFAPRLIEVELEIGEGPQLTLEEVRSMIRAPLEDDPGFWDGGIDVDEVLRQIDATESIAGVFDAVKPLLK